ncbi:MAG: hypothetical protein WBZ57_17350 [Pseudomonas graminis]
MNASWGPEKAHFNGCVDVRSDKAAAQAFIAAGTAANTVRSYRSALAYWLAWLQLRFGRALGDSPLPDPVAIQFILDHLARPLYKGGKVSRNGLSGDQVARIVQRRAKLARLEGDWAAHSLRSGFMTVAGRRGVPMGDVMAMTEHRRVSTVMGYFQAGGIV